MSEDLSRRLLRAAERRDEWTWQRFSWTIVRLLADMPLWLDWDRDSGENWARLVADEEPVALICCLVPVAVVRTGTVHRSLRDELEAEGVEVVEVVSLDASDLSIDREAFESAFPNHPWRSGAAPMKAFSGNDLHWMTAT